MQGACGTRSLWDPAGWWGSADYLFVWRKERFYPALVSTGTLGSGGEILFGDQFETGKCKSGLRLDGGIWLTNCLGVGGSLILVQNDPIKYFTDTIEHTSLARPYLDAQTGLQSSVILSSYADIDIDSLNHMWTLDGYLRTRFVCKNYWAMDWMAGFGYMEFNDNLDITDQSSSGSTGVFMRLDQFHCAHKFYCGIGGLLLEIANCSWCVNFWGKVAFGNMTKDVKIFGETNSNGTITTGGLLALPTNMGTHFSHEFEFVPILGANINARVWGNLYVSLGYLWLYFPRVALAGEQVDLTVNPSQFNGGTLSGSSAPLFELHNNSFWVQAATLGAVLYF
jgi:hypothetical protein